MSIRQSAQASIQATINRDQTPSLTISHPTVIFTPTSPGKPTFQILTIVCPHPDTLVSLMTDTPAYFTLATDTHPRFASDLEFTPSSLQAYVHIRYVANRRGRHTGQLTIRSGDELLTVSLIGQSSILMPQARSYQTIIRRPRSGGFTALKGKKTILGLLALLFVVGLAYLIFTNRYRFSSAQRPDSEIVSSPARTERPVSAPVPAAEQLSGRTDQESAGRRQRTRSSRGQNRVSEPTGELVQNPISPRKMKAEQGTAPSTAVRKSTGLPDFSKTAVGEAAQKRRNDPAEESDLERELNQPTRGPLN